MAERTTEAPTKTGWYWLVDKNLQMHDAEIVQVVDLDLAGDTRLRIYRIGHDVESMDMFLQRNSGVEWVGPLEVPV